MATSLLSRPCSLLGTCRLQKSVVPFAVSGASRSAAATSAVVVQGKGLGQGSWARTTLLRQGVVVRADSNEQGSNVKYNTEFGYSRKDVLLICGGLIALGYALYYGLQALGMEAGYAGNWVQLIIFMGICVGWVSTYIYRVATKQMTYVKQLEAYEEAVMKKRIEEMTEAELQELASEVESDRQRKAAARLQQQKQQQQQQQ